MSPRRKTRSRRLAWRARASPASPEKSLGGPRCFPGSRLVCIGRRARQAARNRQQHEAPEEQQMTIAGKAVLVTGANRGIGQALVEEALRRGAKRVYAGTRQPLAHPDERVIPLTLEVTSPAQIEAAAAEAGSLDILINNAGVFRNDDLGDREALEQHLAVNLFGTYEVTRAFL